MRPPKLSRLQLALYHVGAARLGIFRVWCGGLWWKPLRGTWTPPQMLTMGRLLSLLAITAGIPKGQTKADVSIGRVEIYPLRARVPRAVARYPGP